MKRLLLLILLAPLSVPVATAQKAVSADDLAGEWQVMFNLEEEAESALERMAKKAVAGFMDEIDIRFEFRDGGELIVAARVFDEDADVDSDAEWMINEHGGLIIGENDHYQSDSDSIFFWDDGELAAYEMLEDGRPGARESITLRRLRG